jgi:spore germination protein KA
MFEFLRPKKTSLPAPESSVAKEPVDFSPFSEDLEQNVQRIQNLFYKNDTLVIRYCANNRNAEIRGCLIYMDGMVDNSVINESVVYPFQVAEIPLDTEDLAERLSRQILRINEIRKSCDPEAIVQAIVYGDTVFFIHGSAHALILNTKGFMLRSVAEPDNEKILRGPREGFNESMLANLSLIRRRLRTQDLKMEYMSFGTVSRTQACVCYLDGIVNHEVLTELYRRLHSFEIDGALDIQYLVEMIRDHPHSPFKTVGITERPDVVAAKLLEGRAALLLDGTPVVMTVPFLLIENFQSNEDYYLNYIYTSISRIIRIISFFITICIPAFYVGIVTYHHEMLPTPLLFSLAMARQAVPFPSIIETLGMIVIFQIITETGIRMSTGIGQALSIVGALVIGQSAVEARIVSAPVIIVVALTGITGLVVPKLSSAAIVTRPALLLLTGFLGMYGFIVGMIALMIHLYNLKSFGVPVVTDMFTLDSQKTKDIFIRLPGGKCAAGRSLPKPIPRGFSAAGAENDEKSGGGNRGGDGHLSSFRMLELQRGGRTGHRDGLRHRQGEKWAALPGDRGNGRFEQRRQRGRNQIGDPGITGEHHL